MKPGLAATIVMVLLSACAEPAAPRTGGEVDASRGGTAAPKRLTIGILEEPGSWAPWESTTTAGGAHQLGWVLRRTLTIIDGQGQVRPVLAVSVPTVERGDWQINPDGTMEQRWSIAPNAKWHDGMPVTAEDFVLGWEVDVHPDLPTANSAARRHLSAAVAYRRRSCASP